MIGRKAKDGDDDDEGCNENEGDYKTFLPCTLEDTVTVGMLDTGNTFYSVMSEELARAVGADLDNLRRVPGKETVGTASDGEELEVIGQVRKRLAMRLSAATRPLYIKPMVVRGLSMTLNLSGPWMAKHGMTIDPGRNLVYDGHKIPLIDRAEIKGAASIQHSSCSLYTADDLVIQPNTVAHAPVMIPPRMHKQYEKERIVVMGNRRTENRHRVETFHRALVKIERVGDRLLAKVGYKNETCKPVKIPKGTLYGQGFPVTSEKGIKREPWKICLLKKGDARGEKKPSSEDWLQDSATPTKTADADKGDATKEIGAQHGQFPREGQTKELEEWMVGPTTKGNLEGRCKFLRETFKLDENENLKKPGEKKKLLMVLLYFWESFSWDGRIGRTHLLNHHLTLTEGAKPVRQKVRPIHPALEPSLQQQLLKWLRNDIIEATDSNWNSNLLPCYKPGGDIRWVVDFTALNRVTEVDTFPVGDIQSNLTRLAKAKYYSLLDSQGAYHIVPIHPEDRYKTAFITPYNTFHFKYMPMGMAAAGATFCRLNQLILGKAGITSDETLTYIDDLLVLGADFSGHLRSLYKTIKAFSEAGLLLNPRKCEFFKKEAKYLGYLINSDGVKALPDYVAAVAAWELPTTRHGLRVFLGKTNYYKRFIKDHAIIAKPLTDALKKEGGYAHLTDHQDFEPTDAYKVGFEKLKAALVEAPQLTHPRFDRLDREVFVLDTDWAEDTLCISGALHQRQLDTVGGKERLIEKPIAFMSKKLGDIAKSYSPLKGELAAVLHYLDYFAFYATAGTIAIRTDHQALLTLKSSTEKRGQWARWRQKLAGFNYTIEHRRGKDNTNADSLSRAPHIKYVEGDDVDIFNEAEDGVQILSLEGLAVDRFGASCLGKIRKAGIAGLEQLEGAFTIDDLRAAQGGNEALAEVRRMLRNNEVPMKEMVAAAPNELKEWYEVYDQLYISRDGLIRYATEISRDDGETWVRRNPVALAEDTAYDVAKTIHVYYAHIGFHNTFDKARDKIWCQRLRRVVQKVCDECTECGLKGGKKTDQRHTYCPIRHGSAWDVLNLDFCGPWPRTKRGYQHVLTIEDTFTRWIEAIPVRKADAKSIFNVLTTRFFPIFGLPTYLKTDNGAPFASKLIDDLAEMLKVKTMKSVPYNPASNPVERQHLNIKRALTAICKNKVTTWDEELPTILFSLRVAKNRITGYSPYEMVFGTLPRTRLEHIFGDPPSPEFYSTRHEYVEALQNRIQSAHKWARKNISTAVARTRLQYHKKADLYEVGDKVWLFSPRVSRTGESRKLKSCWSGPWTVNKKLSDVSYKIKPHRLWAMQGEMLVSINRLKRFICAEEDEDTVGHPPALHQELIMAGDEAAEDFVDEEPDSEEDDDADHIADLDETEVQDPFWIDDDYQDQPDIVQRGDDSSSNSASDSDEAEGQDDGGGRNLRRRERIDYHNLHHHGRGQVDAMKDSAFDKHGHLLLNEAQFAIAKNEDLERLTNQSQVIHRRNEASRHQLQRFTHSKKPYT